jgi:hypothetical protein
MISFKKYLTEDLNQLSLVDSGKIPEDFPTRPGYHQKLYHAEIPNVNDPQNNANLWITMLSDPNNDIHEFHYTVHDTVGPGIYQNTKNKLQSRGYDTPLHVMAQTGLIQMPQDKFFSPATMFHLFGHIKTLSDKIPVGDKIIFDSTAVPGMEPEGYTSDYGTRKSSIYRRYLQRFIKAGLGEELQSENPNKIIVRKNKLQEDIAINQNFNWPDDLYRKPVTPVATEVMNEPDQDEESSQLFAIMSALSNPNHPIHQNPQLRQHYQSIVNMSTDMSSNQSYPTTGYQQY